MAQAKREKIVYGDATDYKEDVKNGLIIPREPSKISDSLAEDVKKGKVVPRPGQADTHLAHLSFTQEALLNGTATDKQEEIAKRYYVANIDAINADRKRHGLAAITVEEAVNAAKVVYQVLNNKGKESEELKKDVESGSVIYRRINKDLEEEVLAKNVENVFITTTTTTTTRISTGPAAAAPGGRGNGRVRRSTTEEAPAGTESGSTTPTKKNKGDQSSETVATELPHVAPDHGTTETGSAGEGARPSNGNGGSSVSPSQSEENKGGTEVPTPVQPPVVTQPVTPQPEDPVVPTVPETSTNPEVPVENPTPEPSTHVETEEEKLAKYTEDDFSGSTASWYNFEHPETFYNALPADSTMHLERGKTYRLVMLNTTTNKAEYVEVKHPKDIFTKHIHANNTDYGLRPIDAPVEGGPYKDIVVYDWGNLNELADDVELQECSGMYYTTNESLVPVFDHTKGLKWYDFDDVSKVYEIDDSNEHSALTSEFNLDVRLAGETEARILTMPVFNDVFTKEVEYDGKTYLIRPQDNYTDEAHVRDIVMVEKSKLPNAAHVTIKTFNDAHIVVSNRVLHVETDEEKLAKYHEEDFSSSHLWYNLDNVHVMYTLHNNDLHKVIERGKTYKLAMWNTESNKAEFVEFKHIADVFTETVHANEIDYCVRPQDVYVEGAEGKDIVVYEKSSYDAMPDQTLETMVGIVYQSHTANLAPTVYEYNNQFKWYDLNDTSHVYLVPDTYAYNNLLENLEITVKDTATDSETKMTIPNPSTVFTKEVEYDGKTYVMRPEDEYTEGGVEKNIVIVDKSMTTGFAVYMTSVLGGIKIVSNKSLVKTEPSSTEDPVVNGKKLSEYTEAEFYKSSSIKIPEEPDDDFLIRNADFNLEISTNGIIEIAVQGRTMYGIKATTVADPKTVFTKKMLYGSEEYYIRPEDVYDGHNSKSIVIVPKEFLDICPTTLQNYMNQSGTVYSVSNTDVTDPDAPAPEASPAPTPGSSETAPPTPEAPKNNEIDYSGPNLFKQVNGDYVFLDGSEISYGGEHDNLGNLDDPYDMSKQYNIATPYNDIPMEKLVNKNIIVYGPSGDKEIFMFPDLQYMFDTEVKDNWNTTYLIRSQDLYTNSSESKPIFAIDKSSLGERPLYSLTPHELLYNGPLVNRQNDEFHQ